MPVLRRAELPLLQSHSLFRVRIAIPRADGRQVGFGPLLSIHRASFGVGAVIPMHEHRHDEILSYVLRGTLLHEDSAGNTEPITSDRLMMMNAGTSLWHQESAPSTEVEMLQVLLMPQDEREGEVQFHDRVGAEPTNGWRLLVGPTGSGAPLTIRQRATVHEAVLESPTTLEPPSADRMSACLYVVDGEVEVAGEMLETGDAYFGAKKTWSSLTTRGAARLLLLMVDLAAPVVRGSAWARHQEAEAPAHAGQG